MHRHATAISENPEHMVAHTNRRIIQRAVLNHRLVPLWASVLATVSLLLKMSSQRRFDIVRFFVDFKVDFRTQGHKHCSAGWANMSCPFCRGNKGFHLGIHMETGGCKCRRCGPKKLWDVIKAIVGQSPPLLAQIKSKYQTTGRGTRANDLTPNKRSSLKFPPGIIEMPDQASAYLQGRKFDPVKLAETWGFKFTGPVGKYKFRIIAPIYHDGRLVSYQGRDYTGKSDLRYKACAKEDEVRDHKNCLYGSWLVREKHVVVVEGIADAWRFGPGAVATFGISFTDAQIALLAEYEKVTIVFDDDPQAVLQAGVLGELLKNINPNIDVQIVTIQDGDPGELPQWEADKLMFDLGLLGTTY